MTLLQALEKSHKKWVKKAEITERRFFVACLNNWDRFLGLTEQDCGLCQKFAKKYYPYCGVCPLEDPNRVCCREWCTCRYAVVERDHNVYHKNAVALRDRLAKMIVEEKAREK